MIFSGGLQVGIFHRYLSENHIANYSTLSLPLFLKNRINLKDKDITTHNIRNPHFHFSLMCFLCTNVSTKASHRKRVSVIKERGRS